MGTAGILGLVTAGTLCGWALQGYSAVEHCRDTWVGQCKDTLWLGTAGILCCGWALQGYLGWAVQGHSAVGHCRDTLRLGAAGILGGWSLKSASSRARTTSILKSSNPTARVGNKKNQLVRVPVEKAIISMCC